MSDLGTCNISLQRPQSNCLMRLQQTYEKIQKKPLPPVFKSRIDGPSPEWEIFKRLQLAAEFADSYTKDCMIFSYEGSVDNNGQRLFLVAHPIHFWSCYKIRLPHERCSYEVIRENRPCKLYFDLEFYTAFNSDKDGTRMTKLFIKCVIAAMSEFHNIEIKESNFLWLDASTAQKYSCHLILIVKNTAFENNQHAGIFVSKLLSTLKARISNKSPAESLWPSGEEIMSLQVVTKNDNNIWFCDEAVYSKNRNFRLYLSTKPGKSSPLLLSKHNQYIPSGIGKDKEETIFYDSLISYFGSQQIAKLIKYNVEDSSDNSVSHSAKMSLPIPSQNLSSCLPSPFPNLDAFILSLIKDDIAVGFIRKWKLVTSEQKIIYDIGSYRFCYNIGRHHKSNNIRITVDLRTRLFYQTCLDPECRQFQSEAFPIPENMSFINVPDDFFENIFTQLPSQESVLQNVGADCSTDAPIFKSSVSCKDSVDVPGCIFEDDFSEDLLIDHLPEQEVVCINGRESKATTDISCASFLSKQPEVKKQKCLIETVNPDSCVFNDEFWNLETNSCELLGNVSHEDELLMADAAEAMEAAMDGDIFSEETIF